MKINKNSKIFLLVLTSLLFLFGLFVCFIWLLRSKTASTETVISSQNNISVGQEKEKIKTSDTKAKTVYFDDDYKVYSFDGYLTVLDINFDNIPDIIVKSHISGMDYHDWHEISDFDVYSFYVDKTSDMANKDEHLNVVTKEVLGKKIEEFDRDFAIYTNGACNENETLRLVTIDGVKTILVIIKTENKKGVDGYPKFEQYANYELYELKLTGNRVGSDYIFSHLKTVRSKYASCDIDKFSNDDVVNIIKGEGY